MSLGPWISQKLRLLRARPVAYLAPPPQPLRGRYQKNERLAQLTRLASAANAEGPESLAIDRDGTLVSGFQDGIVRRFDSRGRWLGDVVNTGGHPLGLRFHPDGSLLICDAARGLLRAAPGKKVELLSSGAEGTPFGFTDDLDIDRTGRHVYFSDASARWPFGEDHFDVLEHAGSGRLLHYDMQTRETRVLMRGLQFANGVTLGPGDAFVLVAETGAYRVHKHHLRGPRAGESEVWLDNLPGYPDNIRFNGKDRYWLAVPVPRDPVADALGPWPRLRWGVLQLAGSLPLPVKHAAMALCFDGEGRLVANLQSHARDAYHFVTQVLEHEDMLYLSSLKQKSLACMPLGAALPS